MPHTEHSGARLARLFTADEDSALLRWRNAESWGWTDIGKELHRSAGTCRKRYELLKGWRTAPDKPLGVERPCMTCRTAFLSVGAHNRMCDRCRGNPAEPVHYLHGVDLA